MIGRATSGWHGRAWVAGLWLVASVAGHGAAGCGERRAPPGLFAVDPGSALPDAGSSDDAPDPGQDVPPDVPSGPGPIITEFMADNDDTLDDEDGDSSDWIELYNPHAEPVWLGGYWLSDDPDELAKWPLPDEELAPGCYRLVFASGKDRREPSQELHANFKLSAAGEYLALVDPALRPVQEWDPFPPQFTDISFGAPTEVEVVPLVVAGDAVAWRAAHPEGDGVDWQAVDFDVAAAGWSVGPTGLGFELEDPEPPLEEPIADSVEDWSDIGEQGARGWTYGYWDRSSDADGAYQVGDFLAFPHDGGGHSATDFWNGWSWDWYAGNPPWTEIWRWAAHPNGGGGSPEHWAMRRWTSPVAGTLRLEWHLDKDNPDGNGVTGRIFRQGSELDAWAIGGLDEEGVTRSLWITDVLPGDAIDLALDATGPDGALNAAGDSSEFTARIWAAPDLRPLIATDIAESAYGSSPGVWLRASFELEDPTRLNRLLLSMRVDDGFVAWLNGQRLLHSNAPLEVDWSSTAPTSRADAQAAVAERFDVRDGLDLLQVGANTLAIHGMNVDASDPDMLVLPELEARSVKLVDDADRYFATPTPGADNGTGVTHLGPRIDQVTRDVSLPPGEPLVVEARVLPTLAPVAAVTMRYRVMFEAEIELAMRDDGLGPDATPGDDTWSALVPGGAAAPGQMVRWKVAASDAQGASTRAPAFEDPDDSQEYYGGVVEDPALSSGLPILQLFAEEPDGAATHAGTRVALFHDGELYDNAHMDVHGQSSLGFPKKSHDVDFPRDHRFALAPDLRRMKDINLLSNYADKSRVRNTMAYELFRDAGAAYHLALPVRIELNGEFYAIYDLVEDGDDRWLERLGYDPDGALYKLYDHLEDIGQAEKKTRKHEDKADLQALIDATWLQGEAQDAFVYDEVNVPAMVNFLAVLVLTGGRDCCHKNYYAYRDSEGTGEWWYLPWDVDLTFGRVWNPDDNYFDDVLHWDAGLWIGSNSRLPGLLLARPELQAMYLRRIRTLMDEQVQPPGTPPQALRLENRADELLAQLGADAWLDYEAWPMWGDPQTPAEGVAALKEDFLAPRRTFLYETLSVGVTLADVLISGDVGAHQARWRVPLDDALGTQWTAPGFDDSGWAQGPQGIGYEDAPGPYASFIGTQVDPAESHPEATSVQARLAFTVADPTTLAGLTLRVRYDDGFVAWLNGTEVARRNVAGFGAPGWNAAAADHPDDAALVWEDFDLVAAMGSLQPGDNTLAVQVVNVGVGSSDLLILVELVAGEVSGGGGLIPGPVVTPLIDFGVAEVAADPAESYLQLVNPGFQAIDVSGWRVTGAVKQELRAGTVIPPGGVLYLSPDVNAFRRRGEGPTGGMGLFVQGPWQGALTGAVTLLDRAGQVVSQF